MNKVEELIQQLCPEGVEYKELGDVLDYEQPTKYIVESTSYHNDHETPVLTAGQSFILGYTDETAGIYEASKEIPVIIFDDFTTSFHWVDFSFKVKSSAMKMLRPKIDVDVIFRFVYFAMRCVDYNPQDHARQWISVYSKFQIPIPPLPIQQEIVSILDKFTQLEARKKQYEYYRNELLTFGDEVEWKTLGECVVMNIGGGTPSKAKPEYWNGIIPWASVKDVVNCGTIINETQDFITEEGLKNSPCNIIPKGNIIIITRINPGLAVVTGKEIAINQDLRGLFLKNFLDEKFLVYFFQTINIGGKGTTVKGISIDELERIKIPIPPLAEQERIVNILDKFDALVNDISIGLPAEIEARRKQYEYYRGKLLTFKKYE